MSAGKRPICGAEGRVPESIAKHLWDVCGRDVSAVVVRCFLAPRHPRVQHAGRLRDDAEHDMGEFHWETPS
ncbi:hypothetical protein [Streptomyces fractus]|uniref:hypothetical protein n=1 Tax=Streptomyces fractus TaxID=641806 RepID=UPI003CF54060